MREGGGLFCGRVVVLFLAKIEGLKIKGLKVKGDVKGRASGGPPGGLAPGKGKGADIGGVLCCLGSGPGSPSSRRSDDPTGIIPNGWCQIGPLTQYSRVASC